MGPDFRQLLDAIGVPGLVLRELGACAGPLAVRKRRAPPSGTLLLTLVGDGPGSGATTVAEGLAASLRARRLHAEVLGVAEEDPTAAIEAASDVADVVLLDASWNSPSRMEQALAEADDVIGVVAAGAGAADATRRLELVLARSRRGWRQSRAAYVLNRYDARRDEHRAAAKDLRSTLGTRLIATIHEDAAVRAAAMARSRLREAAPASQVVADLDALAGLLAPRDENAGW